MKVKNLDNFIEEEAKQLAKLPATDAWLMNFRTVVLEPDIEILVEIGEANAGS